MITAIQTTRRESIERLSNKQITGSETEKRVTQLKGSWTHQTSGNNSSSHGPDQSNNHSKTSSDRPGSEFWSLYRKWTECRCCGKYEFVTRHVNQLFIRGDNVVSVAVADLMPSSIKAEPKDDLT